MRHIFSGKGGSLGETGSVSWMFEKLGTVDVKGATNEDALLEKLIDFDIKDVKSNGDFFTIYCDPKALESVKNALTNMNLKVEKAELEWVAKNSMELPADQAEKAYEFLETLQDQDDVQNVYTNLA
jgi:transcriptional/translational regulatory protein YebC/TACO1